MQVPVVRERGLRTNPITKIDSSAITHVCKDHFWFKTYEPVEDRSVLYMGDDHFAHIHEKGRIIHETTAPYTPQQNGVAERKNKALKEMANAMLSYSGLSDVLWGEAMLTACYLLNRVPNKRNKTTTYELCTDQNQVDKTKKFSSSKFSMKDMREADVILGCSLVSSLMDPVEKIMPNTSKHVDQLEYSRAIVCLMYDMTNTRPDIAYVVGRLSRVTSIPSRQHWHAIPMVF
nr:zinc finger, CCHC-type [Tanacetum cinerariifolium]